MKLPRFTPILTSYLERVANRDIGQLLRSPIALSNALAEMQVAVGHDGVLCVYEPTLLARACSQGPQGRQQSASAAGARLNTPDEALLAAPLCTLLDALQPLRYRLPESALLYAALAGPGLLFSQLQSAADRAGAGDGADPGYVVSVIRAAVRAALERKADGVALIERTTPATPPGLLRAHKSVRKMADFYDAGFLVFTLPESADRVTPDPAHCVFDLGNAAGSAEPLLGHADASAGADHPPWTTAGDVAADVPIDTLKQLTMEARGR